MSTETDHVPKFKSLKKKKVVRKRLEEDEESDIEDESLTDKIEELRIIQKLRSKPKGVEISASMLEESESKTDKSEVDTRNVKIGGLTDAKTLIYANSKVDEAYDTGIGTQFSAETNKRDEDEQMMKFIDEELSKRKNKYEESSEKSDIGNEFLSPEEAALRALPEHLRISSAQHSEEMLSNQMLNGIPEVDLGIDVKIKNIEATEEAKLKLLWERQNKSDGPSAFVPTNMAVNFVQHNRFNIEDQSITKQERAELQKKRKHEKEKDNNKTSNEKEPKATDDYHYERFKKQFRRY